MDSRYFATVLRATTMPCCARISEILVSLSGFLEFSELIICLIRALIAVAEHAPPVSVPTWLLKKYFNSNMPRGVCMNFCVVTRDIVDSCRSRESAISRSTMGRIATAP